MSEIFKLLLLKFFSILFLLITSSICLSQSGWILQNSGTTDSLRSVKFLDLNNGWAAGTNGVVLRTSDGGDNWMKLSNPFIHDLHSVFTTSESVCYVTGDSGTILKTSDGGINWVLLNSNVSVSLNSIFFINNLTGFAAGNEGTIIKTTDSGNNWINLVSNSGIQFNSINFANSSRGWVAGYGGILHTTDGGIQWSPQFIDGNLILNSICFVDSLHGWTAYFDNVTFGPENVRTTNAGLSWINYAMNNSYSISIFFINQNKGWSSGFYGSIMYSTDGGVSWTLQVSGTPEHLRSVYFADSLNGWIVGDNGKILRTNTGGMITGISNSSKIEPNIFLLEQNYPNPFNPVTQINYELRIANYVSLKVFDVLGNEVKTLINDKQNSGQYKIKFDATDLPSGIYYYKLKSENFEQVRKMVLIK